MPHGPLLVVIQQVNSKCRIEPRTFRSPLQAGYFCSQDGFFLFRSRPGAVWARRLLCMFRGLDFRVLIVGAAALSLAPGHAACPRSCLTSQPGKTRRHSGGFDLHRPVAVRAH